MSVKRYTLKRRDRAATEIPEGVDTVYQCKGHDYGLASDDSRATGIEHVSVTLDPTGDYPFFTIPKTDLEEVAA